MNLIGQQQKLNKFTIIIPTLFKVPDVTESLISSLIKDEAVGEIILINNTVFSYDRKHEKLKVLNCYQNIFVNPAWNLGVMLAKFEYISLLNDDILLPDFFFSDLLNHNIEDYKLLGCNELICDVENKLSDLSPFDSKIIDLSPIEKRPFNYGVLMVLKKSEYVRIPDEYKIFCGDDYLFYDNTLNDKGNGLINCKIKIQQSSTSNLQEFYEQEHTDMLNYKLNTKNKIELSPVITQSLVPIKTISLCMIVRDEEMSLPRCLASIIDAVEEVIIVDTGSVDRTKQMAALFGDKVKIYDFEWIDDFAAARNYAFSKATMDYQMWLDADDIVDGRNIERLLELKKNLEVGYVMAKYNLMYDDAGNPTYYSKRERLFKRELNVQWIDRIHECVSIDYSDVIYTDFEVNHHSIKNVTSRRNLNIYEDMISKGEVFTPRNTFYYGTELLTHGENDKASEQFQLFLSQSPNIYFGDAVTACIKLHDMAIANNDFESAGMFLCKSFEFSKPSSEVCSKLGSVYINMNRYYIATFWLELALTLNSDNNVFIHEHYNKLNPLINLTLCYSLLGNLEKAKAYHNECMELNPTNASVIHNENYFNSLV